MSLVLCILVLCMSPVLCILLLCMSLVLWGLRQFFDHAAFYATEGREDVALTSHGVRRARLTRNARNWLRLDVLSRLLGQPLKLL
mmetsp:Transcript_35765/g.118489  ORF Transcript_35765/g.118489 Transcript_35765/m.118489 type:complete len:85 (-) Transcript_35765:1396-1650(-)